jgi:hypothetical protein
MMSVATTDLSRSTQHLIDSRLDTIDRMLLGRVSRQERLEIVREVEAQIFEQLHERGAEELSREEVLAVLGRLDPPEAYLSEEEGGPGTVESRASSGLRTGHVLPVRTGNPRLPKVSGILGVVAFMLFLSVPAAYMIAMRIRSAAIFWGFGGAAFILSLIGSIMAVTLGAFPRVGSVWAGVGIATGLLSAIGLFGLAIVPFFIPI